MCVWVAKTVFLFTHANTLLARGCSRANSFFPLKHIINAKVFNFLSYRSYYISPWERTVWFHLNRTAPCVSINCFPGLRSFDISRRFWTFSTQIQLDLIRTWQRLNTWWLPSRFAPQNKIRITLSKRNNTWKENRGVYSFTIFLQVTKTQLPKLKRRDILPFFGQASWIGGGAVL